MGRKAPHWEMDTPEFGQANLCGNRIAYGRVAQEKAVAPDQLKSRKLIERTINASVCSVFPSTAENHPLPVLTSAGDRQSPGVALSTSRMGSHKLYEEKRYTGS
jgi:hypothetical protein